MIADDWLKDKTDRELRVMRDRARNARAITMFGCVLMTMGFSLLVFLPFFGTSLRYITNITDPQKILPLQTYYFYDKDQSPYFELTYAAQGLLLVTAGASYTGVDNLLGLLIFHLCGQMENLKGRLINMKQFKSFNSNLTLIVRDHIRLIKFRIGFNIALGSLRDYRFDVRLFRNTICVLVPIHRCALGLIRTTGIPFSDILILSKTRLLYCYSDCCFILVPSFVCTDF